jgi:hypothetical protein
MNKIDSSFRLPSGVEFYNLRSSPNIKIIKSRMIWAGHEARMGAVQFAHNILIGKLEGSDRLRAT